jgi:hypothetical protein
MKKQKQNTQSIIQAIAAGTALLQVLAVSLVTLGFVLSANANERKTAIITFDVPGAAHGPFQGTHGNAISPQGTITGTFDSNGNHGYVRARDGTFITFDVPGAGTGAFHGTFAYSINPAKTITGFYVDASGLAHGYVRASDGAITTFDVPGASVTFALNINPAGTIAGYYLDASNVAHGFVRAPKGAMTTFDAPGAGTGPGQGTFTAGVDGINPAGAIAGAYLDASNVSHGFVRARDGAITTFDAPGAGTGSGQGTFPDDINPPGAIVGSFLDASNAFHGFLLEGE